MNEPEKANETPGADGTADKNGTTDEKDAEKKKEDEVEESTVTGQFPSWVVSYTVTGTKKFYIRRDLRNDDFLKGNRTGSTKTLNVCTYKFLGVDFSSNCPPLEDFVVHYLRPVQKKLYVKYKTAI